MNVYCATVSPLFAAASSSFRSWWPPPPLRLGSGLSVRSFVRFFFYFLGSKADSLNVRRGDEKWPLRANPRNEKKKKILHQQVRLFDSSSIFFSFFFFCCRCCCCCCKFTLRRCGDPVPFFFFWRGFESKPPPRYLSNLSLFLSLYLSRSPP